MDRKAFVRLLQLLNIAAFILTIVINVLANALPINGRTTGEISDMYPNFFAPAGFTFAIWGLIYVLLGMFCAYQTGILTKNDKGILRLVEDVGFKFALASLANIAWIFCWHYELIILSVAVMIVLLISLIGIYIAVKGRKNASSREKLFVQLPFSVYLGWISVATIANVTILLVSLNWNGFGIPQQIWTIAVIAVAVIIALVMLAVRKDIAYALVVIWAFIGILYKHLTFFHGEYIGIIITVALSIIILTAVILILVKKTKGKL